MNVEKTIEWLKSQHKKFSVKKIKYAYIASPFGFSESGRLFYYEKLIPALEDLGLEIIDPWTLTPEEKIYEVVCMDFGKEQKEAWKKLNILIGKNNTKGIERADIVISILDGVDIDSGTASEVGYAAGKNKYIEGYRGDFRLSADNIGSTVNLQVEYFIRSSGGEISDTLKELINNIERRREK